MSNVIKFDSNRDVTILIVDDTLLSDGTTNSIALVKDKKNGDIGLAFKFGISRGDDFYPEVYKLCEDPDNFLYDKVFEFMEIEDGN